MAAARASVGAGLAIAPAIYSRKAGDRLGVRSSQDRSGGAAPTVPSTTRQAIPLSPTRTSRGGFPSSPGPRSTARWKGICPLRPGAEALKGRKAERRASAAPMRKTETTVPKPAGSAPATSRSEEHTSELQSLMRKPYAVFFLKKKKADRGTHAELSKI